MREAELLDSVRRFFPSARLSRAQAVKLIEDHGHMACMLALPEMQDRGFDWSLQTFEAVAVEVEKAQREQDQKRRDSAYQRQVDQSIADASDPETRARMAGMREALRAYLSHQITKREWLLRQREVLDSGPYRPWVQAQIAGIDVELAELPEEDVWAGGGVGSLAAGALFSASGQGGRSS